MMMSLVLVDFFEVSCHFFNESFSSKQCHIEEILEADYANDEAVCKMIASFRYVRCNYKKFDNPEYFLYESISICLSHFFNTRHCFCLVFPCFSMSL